MRYFPGSFDPLTNGRVDIISRGARLFDRIVVAILPEHREGAMFTVDERIASVREVCADRPNVEVDTFEAAGGLRQVEARDRDRPG